MFILIKNYTSIIKNPNSTRSFEQTFTNYKFGSCTVLEQEYVFGPYAFKYAKKKPLQIDKNLNFKSVLMLV